MGAFLSLLPAFCSLLAPSVGRVFKGFVSILVVDPVQEGFWRQPLLAVLDAVPPLLVTEKQCGMCLWMQLLVLNGGGDTKSINRIISKYRSFLFLGYF